MLQCNTYSNAIEVKHNSLPQTNGAFLSDPEEYIRGEQRLCGCS